MLVMNTVKSPRKGIHVSYIIYAYGCILILQGFEYWPDTYQSKDNTEGSPSGPILYSHFWTGQLGLRFHKLLISTVSLPSWYNAPSLSSFRNTVQSVYRLNPLPLLFNSTGNNHEIDRSTTTRVLRTWFYS